MVSMGRIPQGTRKTKSGAYNRRFTVDGVRYSVTGKTAAELHQKEAEKRQQIKAGLIMSKSGLTLDGYYSDWVKQKEKSIKKQTLIVYKSIYNNHIKAGLGSRKLKDINRLDIKRHINNLHATKTACTTNRALMLLFQIFKEAKRDRVITINPVEDIQRIKEDKTETARDTIHRALTQSEIDLFFKALEGNPYETILLFMINTGVRIGEAGALNWGDVDLFNGIVKINKTISFTGDITSPKLKTNANKKIQLKNKNSKPMQIKKFN